eukprot:411881_1
MSSVLNIGAFAIRLNAPTSTSKHIEIATRFCGKHGILIQLNNQSAYSGAYERFFDCSWLSNYPEEDERIFVRGRYKLEIQSIRVLDQETNQWKNYQLFMRSFYLLDSMISGDWPNNQTVNSNDILIIESSIDNYLKREKNDFDVYVNDAFYLFAQKK